MKTMLRNAFWKSMLIFPRLHYAALGLRSRKNFREIRKRTECIKAGDIIACSVIYNEKKRLPFFLEYYRGLGVDHFLFLDNESDDDTAAYLAGEPDCSIWEVHGSFSEARQGHVWSHKILHTFCRGHWVVRLDPDEFLIYPYSDTRTLHDLTEYLESIGKHSLYTLMVDCYGKTGDEGLSEGENMLVRFPYFDGYGYTIDPRGKAFGGWRQRAFLTGSVREQQLLRKFPLVKWSSQSQYMNVTHKIFPPELDRVHGEQAVCPTGCLLHFKVDAGLQERAMREASRGEYSGGSFHYRQLAELKPGFLYREGLSVRYESWRTLESLGLLGVGDWR